MRVYSQKFWPGAGDVDDCWVLGAYMAIHAVAPWLWLPSIRKFRELAGKPDTTGPSGGTVQDAARAIRQLYPKLDIGVSSTIPWAEFVQKVKSGRPASLTLLSGSLPVALRYGFTGVHQVAVEWDGTDWRIANPLADPHSNADIIAQADLRKAVEGYQPMVSAVLMPTEAQAFKTHPLYVAPVVCPPPADCAAEVLAGRRAQWDADRADARITAATISIGPRP